MNKKENKREGQNLMSPKYKAKSGKCALCGADCIFEKRDSLTVRVYECPECGTYKITDEARADLEGIADDAKALAVLRKRIQNDNKTKVVTFFERGLRNEQAKPT